MKAVSGIMLTLLLMGMLTLTFNIETVEASGTIYIRADGSVEPDTAPISTVDNITYTFTDNINDSVVVERDNIVVDGAGYTLQGTGSGDGIRLLGRSNVTIKNTVIKAFRYGIRLDTSSNNTVSGNNIIADNHYGVYLDYSSNNTLSENSIANNRHGMCLIGSSDNRVYGNNITNNYAYGIKLDHSSDVFLHSNLLDGNRYGFGVLGWELNHYLHSIDTSNLVDGKPVYYLISQHNFAIDPSTHPEVGFLALVKSTNITVEGLTLTKNLQGLLIAYTSNTKIQNNNITNNDNGVTLCSSSNNTVSANQITANWENGIHLYNSSENSIAKNKICDNTYARGIRMRNSTKNNVSSNEFFNNAADIKAILSNGNTFSRNNFTHSLESWILYGSDANNITHNTISHSDVAISVHASDNNLIASNLLIHNDEGVQLSGGGSLNNLVGNTITNNEVGIELERSGQNRIGNNTIAVNDCGIKLYRSDGNEIFHNNMIENREQVINEYSISFWDNGYEGNYWSDYTGTDGDDDGIGDTPYVIDADNEDRYPLMKPLFTHEHDLAATVWAPVSLEKGEAATIQVPVCNLGLCNETDVHLQLLINGMIAESENISELTSGSTHVLNHSWTPTVEGKYNLTAYVTAVPNEYTELNNLKSVYVDVYTIGPTTLQVHPPEKQVTKGTTFSVTVRVANVTDLFAWQVAINYNATVLNCTAAWYPKGHVFEGRTFLPLPPSIWKKGEKGYVLFGCTLLDYDEPTFHGTGTLCEIQFSAVDKGTSPLHICVALPPTKLENRRGDLIKFTTEDGTVRVVELPWDLNGDGIVDVSDVAEAGRAFGSYPGHERWNPIADVNDDNIVDISDLAEIARHFGEGHS